MHLLARSPIYQLACLPRPGPRLPAPGQPAEDAAPLDDILASWTSLLTATDKIAQALLMCNKHAWECDHALVMMTGGAAVAAMLPLLLVDGLPKAGGAGVVHRLLNRGGTQMVVRQMTVHYRSAKEGTNSQRMCAHSKLPMILLPR